MVHPWVLALEEFRSLGIQFISYQENIDTSSPLGQAMFTIVSAVAQLERDVIRERVKAGLRVAKAKGVVLGRPGLLWILALSSGCVLRAFVDRGEPEGLNLSRATAQRAAKVLSAQG